MSQLKRILIHDFAGHPFQLDLSKHLANKGYEIIHAYTSSSGGPKAGFDTKIKNLKINNISIPEIQKGNFFQRGIVERQYGYRLISKIKKWQPDLIISANTPLLSQYKLVHWAKKHNIPFVFWLQDLLSLAAKSILPQKIGFAGKVIANHFEKLEIGSLRNSDHIISVTEDFIPFLSGWGIPESQITVIRNWAPIEEIDVNDKDNEFARKHNLVDKFVVLYSGTLGMKQNPGLIYETARLLKSDSSIQFVVVSQGIGEQYLRSRQKENQLKNLTILPFQPFELFPKVLSTGDVILAILEKDAATYCVPSKVWSSFCSQRPSILVVPQDNLAARITNEIGAGIVVRDDSPEKLKEAILKLKKNSELAKQMGQNARKYAEENFKIEKISQRFEDVFIDVMN